MLYTGKLNFVLAQFDLGTFSAIYQEKLSLHFQNLGGRVVKCPGSGRITA